MKTMKMKKLGGLIGVLLLLAILTAANLALRPLRLRFDATQDKLYTLSDGTKELLDHLDRDVTVKFYFSRSNPRVPVPVKNFAARVRDLLREYETRSGGYLVVEEYDPKPDSDEEEWAQRYGLQPLSTDIYGENPFYFGIVAVSGNHESVIPVLEPRDEPRLEYLLTRMISEVVREKPPKVGIMSPLPVDGGGFPMGSAASRWVFVSELRQLYDVQNVPLSTEKIPDDIDTLVLIHPAGLSEKTLYAIDQFILRGGRLLAFVDPLCLTARESADPRMMRFGMPPPQTSSDLNRLTSAWGLTMDTDQLAADEALATLIGVGNNRAVRNPAWLSLREENINQEDIATVQLSDIMLPFAGAFEGTVSNGLERTDLLYTTDGGFYTDVFSARSGEEIRPSPETHRLVLALRLSGTFHTAFPDGKPADEKKDEANAEDKEKKDEKAEEKSLKESVRPGVVVLVGDVDFIADRFATSRRSFFGHQFIQPRNENLSFALNLVEQLCGSRVLIGLRSRNVYDRPFDRVIALEKEAALKWQAEEDRLNEKLQAVQKRLNELQKARGDHQQLMLSPEQQAEIRKFREEVFQTQQALKEVRKNLRRDIERLGLRVKVINILAVPLLVALFGILRGLWLRKTR